MDAYVLNRADEVDDGESRTEDYQELPGGANISLILESTSHADVGPRLHQHPYAEKFIIRRRAATLPIGPDVVAGHAGQVLVVSAHGVAGLQGGSAEEVRQTPHEFVPGSEGYEAVHIHANPRFVTEWLE